MLKYLARSAAGWLAATLLLTTGSSSPAADRIVVRTYNTFGVASNEMARARQAASAILRDADVQVVWRDCSRGCEDALRPRELMVRIVAAPKAIVANSLGCSVIDLQARAGTLATVYADRIESTADRAHVDAGTLLGRAVAHEIGHLLLGTSRHSEAGLMRARWSDRELQRDFVADWTLSPDDVEAVHRGLVARVRRSPAPAEVMASVRGTETP